MTGFDYVVFAVIGLAVLLGVLRGAVKEVLTLAGWVAAFVLANAFAPWLAALLANGVANPTLRLVGAWLLLFLGVLLVSAVLSYALREVVRELGLGGVDRLLGVLDGYAKGVLIVLIGVIAAGMTQLPREPFWRNAMSSRWFETLAIAAKPWLPDDIARRMRFATSRA